MSRENSRENPRRVEVEVVSAGGKNPERFPKTGPSNDPLFALFARLMDDVFKIPGTNIRFGLDPLIGLIPGLGDGYSALVSALLMVRGAQAGLPRIILARMALNVVINTVGGAIPLVGDIFSVWFKSNRLNFALYEKHAGQRTASTKTDWVFVAVLVIALLLFVGFMIALSITLLTILWRAAWGNS